MTLRFTEGGPVPTTQDPIWQIAVGCPGHPVPQSLGGPVIRTAPARRLTTGIVAVLTSVLAMTALAAAPALADNDPAPLNGGEASRDEPVRIDVPVPTVPAPGREGMNGVMEIRVGRSAPFLVMVDTGSVGLRVFPGAWGTRPAGVTIGGERVSTTSGGSSMSGFLGKAPMTIGGVTTTRPIGFQFVDSSAAVVRGWAAKRVYGIIGIGTGRYRLTNPLTALPGEVGTRWSLHLGGNPLTRQSGMGHLILGAENPGNAEASFQLPPLGPDGYGALLWNDHAAPGCWTFGATRTQCIDTWFDSGFHPMRVKGAVFSRVPTTPSKEVRAGTRVALADAGSSFDFWDFRAGRTASANEVRLASAGGAAINTGNAPYFRYVVTYDVTQGLISLSNPRR